MPTDSTYIQINRNQRSEMVREIVSRKPGFLVRYGILFFFFVLCLIGLTSWFIQYPDIVNTRARLTSINSPKEVKTKMGGRLVRLLAKEGRFVQQDDILGFIESRANHYEVLMLSKIVDTFQKFLQNDNTEIIPAYLKESFQNLGEVQQPYQDFILRFELFKQYLSSGYYLKKKQMLRSDLGYLQKLQNNLLEQKGMQSEDLNLAQATLEASRSLNNDKVISPLDYRTERSKYINKALTIPQINSSIILNESNQHEKQKEILQLENEIAQQKTIFSEALNTFKSQLDEWKSKYLLTAPTDGKIAFVTFLQENQQLQINQTVCYVNPENSQYYAELYIPQSNFGKVQIGQEVLLKFPAYPFQEYGSIRGRVDFISHITTDSGYLAKVILANGLNTDYNKKIQFREGLIAQGEIITKNMRMLEKFYYKILDR